jgi:uncharacterized protein (TIGR02611 family)
MHHVKRVARVVAGFALLLAGVAMLALPGPGWVTIAVGLALLSREFPWAEKSLNRLKDCGARALAFARRTLNRARRRQSGT